MNSQSARLGRLIIRALALTSSLVLMFPTPAAAQNWGTNPGGNHWCTESDPHSKCTTKDQNLSVFFESDVPAAVKRAFVLSLEQDYSHPQNEYQAAEVLSKRAADVIVVWKDSPAADPGAYTTCADNATYGRQGWYRFCKPQLIVLDSNDPAFGDACYGSATCRHWIACHELGHTFGLQHTGRTTCMNDNNTSGGPGYLDAHDKEHLVDCYPAPTGRSTLTEACRRFDG